MMEERFSMKEKYTGEDILQFYRGKRVLVTGHTGFKGTWLTRILLQAGARVQGYSLEPPTTPNLYAMAGFSSFLSSGQLQSEIADIRDFERLEGVFHSFRPEIVFHLAAQPIVRESYRNPRDTYETNVMGTVNVLECIRGEDSVRSFVNVTTDKVYRNREWVWGYRETDPLDGFDPYSNSKSCSELATHSYRNSFFSSWDGKNGRRSLAVSTARAGNVIGGGDFADDRIIPDCVRAAEHAWKNGEKTAVIGVRNPYSTRPYQHVLEPLGAYLLIAKRQMENLELEGYYNVGPDDADCLTTGDLVTLFCAEWNKQEDSPVRVRWENRAEKDAPHEAGFLKLDTSLIRSRLHWRPTWNMQAGIQKTVEFSRKMLSDEKNVPPEMERQIREFFLR